MTGISAVLLAAVLARRTVPTAVVLAWNVLGSVLLATILVIAILSTPIIQAFGSRPDQLNTWIAYFPFVFLALLVSYALFGHVVLFRRLAERAASRTARTLGEDG